MCAPVPLGHPGRLFCADTDSEDAPAFRAYAEAELIQLLREGGYDVDVRPARPLHPVEGWPVALKPRLRPARSVVLALGRAKMSPRCYGASARSRATTRLWSRRVAGDCRRRCPRTTPGCHVGTD